MRGKRRQKRRGGGRAARLTFAVEHADDVFGDVGDGDIEQSIAVEITYGQPSGCCRVARSPMGVSLPSPAPAES